MHILRSGNDHCNTDTIRNFKLSLQCCSIMPSDKYVNIEVCSCTEQIHSILQCSFSVPCSVSSFQAFLSVLPLILGIEKQSKCSQFLTGRLVTHDSLKFVTCFDHHSVIVSKPLSMLFSPICQVVEIFEKSQKGAHNFLVKMCVCVCMHARACVCVCVRERS